MEMIVRSDVADIICCPRCHSNLRISHDGAHCEFAECSYARDGFPVAGSQLVLVDFDQSIFRRSEFADRSGKSAIPRDVKRARFTTKVRAALLAGGSEATEERAKTFVKAVLASKERGRVLIIGGGTVGAGMRPLYANQALTIVGTDVYASQVTDLIADGHCLPFRSGSFDGVWIQAVLEHVLDPGKVSEEIYRVLNANGIVFADTPFMQQVHEGAYDFTRFTLSGHRWLFRRFELLDAGIVGGAGTAFIWSYRYLMRALTGGDKIATLMTIPFFWVRFLDAFVRTRFGADAASGVFFLGRKSAVTLAPSEMVGFYERQKDLKQGNGSLTVAR